MYIKLRLRLSEAKNNGFSGLNGLLLRMVILTDLSE